MPILIAILVLLVILVLALSNAASSAATIEAARAAQAAANAATMASAAHTVSEINTLIVTTGFFLVICVSIWAGVQIIKMRGSQGFLEAKKGKTDRPAIIREIPEAQPAAPQLPAPAQQSSIEDVIKLSILANIANAQKNRDY